MENTFEHFFACGDEADIGATGQIHEVSVQEDAVRLVGGLCFDLDTKSFADGFHTRMAEFVHRLLPEAGVRQTSAAGNYHVVVKFTAPPPAGKGKTSLPAAERGAHVRPMRPEVHARQDGW